MTHLLIILALCLAAYLCFGMALMTAIGNRFSKTLAVTRSAYDGFRVTHDLPPRHLPWALVASAFVLWFMVLSLWLPVLVWGFVRAARSHARH